MAAEHLGPRCLGGDRDRRTRRHGLDLDVLAEGVDRPGHVDSLRENGYGAAQGLSLGEPVPTDRLGRLLEAAEGLGHERSV